MKIVLEAGSGTAADPRLGPFTLADTFNTDELRRIIVDSNSEDPGALFEKVDFLRAPNPKFFPRQNAWIDWTFTTVRQHASYNAAGVFWMTHAAELPLQGLITVTHNAGPDLFIRYLNAAIIEPPKLIEWQGVQTRWRYSIHGQGWLINRPTT